MADARPIIIIKKKVAHAGHHGGAWKVAYADFVTAMMALFIVLWLLNSSKQIQEAVGGYFKDPTGTSKKVGTGKVGSGENFTLTKDNMSKLKAEIQAKVRKMADFDKLKNQIEMTITAEGLRIELMETEKGTFFPSGVAEPTDDGREILRMLAQQLGTLPNTVSIEGHTDARPYSTSENYTNWELSADRANAARRVLQQNGLGSRQVTQVRGYADQRPRKSTAPTDPSNRRISVVVQYLDKPDEADEAPATPAKPGSATKPGSVAAKPGPAAAKPAPSSAHK
jgi:chemotaxis protein MotB